MVILSLNRTWNINLLFEKVPSILILSHLKSNKEGDGLYTVVSSVHIVSHEQIVGVRRLASDPEELHEVMKLTMHISTHSHWTLHLNTKVELRLFSMFVWSVHLLDIALFGQDFLGLFTQSLDLIL